MDEQIVQELLLSAEDWERQVFAEFSLAWSPPPLMPLMLGTPQGAPQSIPPQGEPTSAPAAAMTEPLTTEMTPEVPYA